jgi:hypothetical protein
MSTLQVEAQITETELLKAVDQLGSHDFQQFVGKVLTMRAKRNAGSLPTDETDLLLKINQGLPEKQLDRYVQLTRKRDDETLTPEEHTELLGLTDQVEQHDANRVQALAELAALRKTTLVELMNALGI